MFKNAVSELLFAQLLAFGRDFGRDFHSWCVILIRNSQSTSQVFILITIFVDKCSVCKYWYCSCSYFCLLRIHEIYTILTMVSKLYFIQYVFLSWIFPAICTSVEVHSYLSNLIYIMKGVDIYKQLMTLVNTTVQADALLKKICKGI